MAEFEMGRRGFIRASISEFRGRRYADLRLWVEKRDQPPGSALIATRKGLSVPIEFLPELYEALEALQQAS